ncbi:unnamed protein product [Parnassius mnemosyne]|uniref:Gustatory receptor n=1 Tax=Parnassius mnemosyne TaxID=213953 RepID=A0AAV1L7D5_9NEOP
MFKTTRREYIKKIKFRTNKLCPSLNYLQNDFLDNYLDADLQKYLFPINLVQFVLFSPKYNIRDNFITSNNRTINCISLLISFCFILSYIIIIAFDDPIKKFEKLLLTLFVLKYFLYCVGCGLNSIVNIIQSDTHVMLILTIQKIKKYFKLVTIDNRSIIISWVHVLILCSFYILYYLFHIIKEKLTLTMVFTYLLLLLADLNTVYMLRMIKLLRNYLVLWITEMKQFNTSVVNEYHSNKPTRLLVFWQTKVSVLKRILDATYICKELCEIPVRLNLYRKFLDKHTILQIFFHISGVVLYCCYIYAVSSECPSFNRAFIKFVKLLRYFQFYLNNFQIPNMGSYTLFLFMFTLKNITLLFLISFEREKYFVALKNTEVVLLMTTVADVSPDERLAYKTLRRLNRAAYKMMNSSSMVTVDAKLPLRIISVLATYVIVLLQFAFL